MKKSFLGITVSILLVFLICPPGFGLTGEAIVRLKKEGVSDETIQVIVQEKAIETAAFSVQEIVDMKRAGIGEKTIRTVIKQGSFLRNSESIVYGKDIRTIEFAGVQDIIDLKNEGVSDEVIEAIITVVGESTASERQEALNFLKDMNIRIVLRDD